MEARYCGCSPLDLDRVYAPDLQKTFFCYGGSDTAGKTLYHEVVYYDHRTGEVSRRTIVLDKHTPDAHDNPALQIDRDGYLWLFSNAHGRGRPSFIHRSARPYDITRFENVHPVKEEDGREAPLNNFSYLLAFYDPACGFLALFTHYTLPAMHSGKKDCRVAAFMTSPDGVHWSAWQDIANIAQGHYQSGGMWGKRIGTAFNYHPDRKLGAGLDYRANLYYVYTDDFGKRWRNAAGKALSLPQRRIDNPASEGWKVYINDLNYDRDGQPVILYELSRGWEPGPQNGPRRWYTARWTGSRWEILPITSSDHNYDLGSLYIEEDGTWRIIAPTGPGPQPCNTGGEIVLWTSIDQGRHRTRVRNMVPGSRRNHAYPRRPVHADPGFYAFWADGNGRRPSPSTLYFSDREGRVFRLPRHMQQDSERPSLRTP